MGDGIQISGGLVPAVTVAGEEISTPITAGTRLRMLLPQHALAHVERARAAVTVSFGGTMLGAMACTVGRVSSDPPRILVALEDHPRMVAAIDELGSFALNLIHHDGSGPDRRLTANGEIDLDGLAIMRGRSGHPLLVHSIAQLACTVYDAADASGLHIYLAEITHASVRTGATLDGITDDIRDLSVARDEATYREMRRAVVEREFPLDSDLRVPDLVTALNVTRANVTGALARLVQDGLLLRRGADRYGLTPVDEALILNVSHARRIMLMGITDALVVELTSSEIDMVVQSALATRNLTSADVDKAGYDRPISSFEEVFVRLAGNPVILDAYRRLNFPLIVVRALWQQDHTGLHTRLSELALEFAQALSIRNRDRAVGGVREFNDCIQHHALAALRLRGGRL